MGWETRTTEPPAPPRRLRSRGDWQAFLESSRTTPVLLFKHSPFCDISSFVFEDFCRFLSDSVPVPSAFVMVVEDRNLSDAIAGEMGIRHQSPQLIVINNEKPIWQASHRSIDLEEVGQILFQR